MFPNLTLMLKKFIKKNPIICMNNSINRIYFSKKKIKYTTLSLFTFTSSKLRMDGPMTIYLFIRKLVSCLYPVVGSKGFWTRISLLNIRNFLVIKEKHRICFWICLRSVERNIEDSDSSCMYPMIIRWWRKRVKATKYTE